MIDPQEERLKQLANAGHYLALRVGFAFPLEEVNALDPAWIDLYSQRRLMVHDPVIRWVYGNDGCTRWSDIDLDDPKHVMALAREHDMAFGAAVSVIDPGEGGQRSFGSFARHDREFSDGELAELVAIVRERHSAKLPPDNLTQAEIEVLRMVKEGLRLKQIAYDLGVSEGAIKQRLRNARLKLDSATGAQAAARAAGYGLI